MHRYKRLLVNLNMEDNDLNLIKYAAVIAQMAHSEKIYFLYTEKKMEIPEELIKEYPQLTESVADFARDKIKAAVGRIFGGENNLETIIIVQEGQTLDELLKQVRINGIDLVLCSVSKEKSQSTSLAIKLARKASCSVLVVPEESGFDLTNLNVALDFSESSADALDAGLAFTRASQVSKLGIIHVYQVPTGFHKTGKTYEEFSEIMKSHARNRFAEFKNRFITKGIRINEMYLLDSKPVDAIMRAIKEHKITFLVVGTRGLGAGAAAMLGSVSERLIENLDIPVLAVKKKGSGLSILNAIFN